VDIAMGVITVQCPRTGKQVSTGIVIDRPQFDRMREKRFTMTCWLCGGEHVWSKRWATFVEDFREEDHDRQPGAAREWA
jgi:endogenous inhibitor of DNA gyrase (YacG/DUF329 family)